MRFAGRLAAAAIATAIAGAAVAVPPPQPAAAATPPLRFSEPVLVSPELAATWEPIVLVDRFGTILISARKMTNAQLVLSPDDRSPTKTRSMSWLWYSADGGRTFANVPGLPLDLEQHNWGYEADIAIDGRNRLYMVDQTYADSTITRWTITGKGTFRFDFHRAALPTGQPVDDRPWLAAHGDGTVAYVTNAGASFVNPVSKQDGGPYGPGRYSVFRSTDAGETFETQGRMFADSGGCRPAADPRPGQRTVIVVCTNDGGAHGLTGVAADTGTLWAYVSTDGGATFARHRVGSYRSGAADTYDWPHVAFAPNGDVYALHVDAEKVEEDGESARIVTNALKLYRSRDRGRTWTMTNVTPKPGRYRWGWLRVAPDGKIAIAIHHRPSSSAPWHAYASLFAPGERPVLAQLDRQEIDAASRPEPPSEMIGIDFLPDGSLAAAWTRVERDVAGNRFYRVYFARSISPAGSGATPRKPPSRVAGVKRPLAATGVTVPAAGALAMLGIAVAMTSWLRRRAA